MGGGGGGGGEREREREREGGGGERIIPGGSEHMYCMYCTTP